MSRMTYDIRLLLAEGEVIAPWINMLKRIDAVARDCDVSPSLMVVVALARSVHACSRAGIPIDEVTAMVRAGAEHIASGKRGTAPNLLELPEFARFRPPPAPPAVNEHPHPALFKPAVRPPLRPSDISARDPGLPPAKSVPAPDGPPKGKIG